MLKELSTLNEQKLTTPVLQLHPASQDSIDRIKRLEEALLQLPQHPSHTHHLLHGGMYVRTIRIPAGVAITGALIKVSTVLIFNGHASLFNDGEAVELCGYHVIPAFRGRKQVFLAHTDTDLSMLFPSTAKSVEEAEEAFTDEADRLISRLDPKTNSMMITGE